MPVEARFFAPVQPSLGAHPVSCKMGTGSFPGVKCGQGVLLTPHPLLVPWSRQSRAVPLLPLWVVRPVQSLSACTRVRFSFTLSCCTSAVLLPTSAERIMSYGQAETNYFAAGSSRFAHILAKKKH